MLNGVLRNEVQIIIVLFALFIGIVRSRSLGPKGYYHNKVFLQMHMLNYLFSIFKNDSKFIKEYLKNHNGLNIGIKNVHI